MSKGISTIWFIIVGVVLIVGSVYWYYADDIKLYLGSIDSNGKNGAVCTQEAKLCLDGSYVGRTGPNCEFAECPKISAIDDQRCLEKARGEGVCSGNFQAVQFNQATRKCEFVGINGCRAYSPFNPSGYLDDATQEEALNLCRKICVE